MEVFGNYFADGVIIWVVCASVYVYYGVIKQLDPDEIALPTIVLGILIPLWLPAIPIATAYFVAVWHRARLKRIEKVKDEIRRAL